MKDCPYKVSAEKLKCMQSWNLFMQCIVTGDETWMHRYDSETKQQSMQWKRVSPPIPHKFKLQTSAGRIMCTVYWVAESILVLLIDYVPHKVTITVVCNAGTWHTCFYITMHLVMRHMLDKL